MRVDNASVEVLVSPYSNSAEAGRRADPEFVNLIAKPVVPVQTKVGRTESGTTTTNTQPEILPASSEKEVIDAIEKANKKLVSSNSHLQFSIHEKTKKIMVKVVDNQTEETIREIPPEKILNMVANMLELAGIMFDEHV